MQNINAINEIAEQTRREKERKRKEVVARIKQQHQRRREAAELANAQARVDAQKALREEVKRQFMLNPWATEADFNEAWKRDKLTMIREYQQSLHTTQRM
jgi:F0F1-type ATP synthase membrane subunit b/b'